MALTAAVPWSALSRFAAKVNVTEAGCWEWTAFRDRHGYGRFRVNGRTEFAHRFAYEALVGPIPEHLVLDHFACDRPACANPDHVRPVTRRENNLRGRSIQAANLAKELCPRGHPYSGPNLYVFPSGARGCRACRPYYKRSR